MWRDCLDCNLIEHCPGRCDKMQETIDLNKKLVEQEDNSER
jgi:radical SAM protein with 4Fe4S-binding SPASM domain